MLDLTFSMSSIGNNLYLSSLLSSLFTNSSFFSLAMTHVALPLSFSIKLTGTSFIKDTEEFVNKIKGEKLLEGEKIVSFDIVDMYPSLPKIEVLNEITRRINQENYKANIKKDALKYQYPTIASK